jgi:transcriptional regulator with XRE-family HTH domain/sRNA-binding regulator protein Hfq
MSNNLWELRKKRNMTVKQLAAKSGVPATNIYAYETGELVKMADLEKLAKALFVNKADIKFQSDPIAKTKPEPPAPRSPKPSPPPRPAAKTEGKTAAPARKTDPSQPATEGQIAHLRALITKLEDEATAVAHRLGKPLEELTAQEARAWLKTYEQEIKSQVGTRPPRTRRWRSSIPEQVDEFESNYLQARQEAGDTLTFTLLNETVLTGRIIGFSPYTITIQQADSVETSLQKLALAYYQVAPAPAAEEAA